MKNTLKTLFLLMLTSVQASAQQHGYRVRTAFNRTNKDITITALDQKGWNGLCTFVNDLVPYIYYGKEEEFLSNVNKIVNTVNRTMARRDSESVLTGMRGAIALDPEIMGYLAPEYALLQENCMEVCVNKTVGDVIHYFKSLYEKFPMRHLGAMIQQKFIDYGLNVYRNKQEVIDYGLNVYRNNQESEEAKKDLECIRAAVFPTLDQNFLTPDIESLDFNVLLLREDIIQGIIQKQLLPLQEILRNNEETFQILSGNNAGGNFSAILTKISQQKESLEQEISKQKKEIRRSYVENIITRRAILSEIDENMIHAFSSEEFCSFLMLYIRSLIPTLSTSILNASLTRLKETRLGVEKCLEFHFVKSIVARDNGADLDIFSIDILKNSSLWRKGLLESFLNGYYADNTVRPLRLEVFRKALDEVWCEAFPLTEGFITNNLPLFTKEIVDTLTKEDLGRLLHENVLKLLPENTPFSDLRQAIQDEEYEREQGYNEEIALRKLKKFNLEALTAEQISNFTEHQISAFIYLYKEKKVPIFNTNTFAACRQCVQKYNITTGFQSEFLSTMFERKNVDVFDNYDCFSMDGDEFFDLYIKEITPLSSLLAETIFMKCMNFDITRFDCADEECKAMVQHGISMINTLYYRNKTDGTLNAKMKEMHKNTLLACENIPELPETSSKLVRDTLSKEHNTILLD